jgi:hypothetical protein
MRELGKRKVNTTKVLMIVTCWKQSPSVDVKRDGRLTPEDVQVQENDWTQ